LFVGHTAHWMVERGESLAKFPFPDGPAIASLCTG
jgi:hypothetical protein